MVAKVSTEVVLEKWHRQIDDEVAECLSLAMRRGWGVQVVLQRRSAGSVMAPKVTFYTEPLDKGSHPN